MYKIKNKLSPSFICDLVQESNNDHTRSHFSITKCDSIQTVKEKNIVSIPKVNTAKSGIESFSFIGPLIWNSLSEELKACESLVSFKSKLKD